MIKNICIGIATLTTTISAFQVLAKGEPNALQQRVHSMQANGVYFKPYQFFSKIENVSGAAKAMTAGTNDASVAGAKFFRIDNRNLRYLRNNPGEAISMIIPFNDSALTSASKSIKVNLFRRDIYSKAAKFSMRETQNGPIHEIDSKEIDLGVHYQGVIEGEEDSIVALSFFKNSIEGRVHSHKVGDLNVGLIKDKNGKLKASGNKLAGSHVIYRINSLENKKPEHKCGSDIKNSLPNFDHASLKSNALMSAQDVNSLPELKSKGIVPSALNDYYFTVYTVLSGYLVSDVGESNLSSWVGSVLNQVSAVYNVDGLYLYSEGWSWYKSSPVYDGRLGTDLMKQFAYYNGANTKTSDVGMLLTSSKSSASNGYGLAHKIGGICSYDTIDGLAYSPVWSTYSYFPTYSWTVDVYAHEAGHTLGSAHTHACSWWGNNTAIDSCANRTEGSCALPGYPANGQGTVMSYCANNVGKNPALGFHSQVAARLKSYVLGCADR